MFELETIADVTVVTVSAEMDARTAGEAKDAFKKLVADGRTRLVIDLSPLDFIDSSGLGALVTALKTARQAGGDVRLCGLATPVKSIFELTRLFRVFDIFAERDAAVASFAG